MAEEVFSKHFLVFLFGAGGTKSFTTTLSFSDKTIDGKHVVHNAFVSLYHSAALFVLSASCFLQQRVSCGDTVLDLPEKIKCFL